MMKTKTNVAERRFLQLITKVYRKRNRPKTTNNTKPIGNKNWVALTSGVVDSARS